jgi:PIN domain nuclease of toxin-antitoxin system
MVVLDTAALLYWTLDPARLSDAAREAIDLTDRIVVSSISIWEIALKVKQRKLEIPLSISEYVNRVQQIDSLEILPVEVQTWLDNLELDWEHRDPADRTIVAIATRQACPLITSDKAMAEFYPQVIW